MRPWLGLLLIAAAAGCGKESEETGGVEIRWTGADTGGMEAPATARWCDSERAAEIVGIAGDSGIALALFPVDTMHPGVYPVSLPGQSARPRASMSLRRFGENMVLGYYSLSGTVTVDSGRGLSGSYEASLTELNTSAQLNVSGSFRNLTLVPGDPTCGAGSRSNPPDRGVR